MKPFKRFLSSAKSRAKKSNISFEITIEDLQNKWVEQKGICPISGWWMILPSEDGSHICWPRKASLDRKDSQKGYTPDNIQFVTYMAQCCKNCYLTEQVIEFCRAVADYNKDYKCPCKFHGGYVEIIDPSGKEPPKIIGPNNSEGDWTKNYLGHYKNRK